MSNALANAQHYGRSADYGLVPIAFRLGLARSPTLMFTAAHLTTALAVIFCFFACFSRRLYLSLTLLGVAMVFLCHHDYGLVYILPAFACWLVEEERYDVGGGSCLGVVVIEATLWFMVFESVLCAYSLSALVLYLSVSNLAVILLGVLSLVVVATSLRQAEKRL